MYADQSQMLAKKKQTASILALVAAVLMTVSLFLPWLKSKKSLGLSMTLLSITREDDGHKESMSNFKFADDLKKAFEGEDKQPGTSFPYFGLITLVVCLGAAAAMLAAGVLGLTGKFVASPIALTTVGLLASCLGLITGCIFVAVKPGDSGRWSALGVSWPFFLFGTAVVMGVAACQMLAKAFGPPEYDPYADPMAPQPPM